MPKINSHAKIELNFDEILYNFKVQGCEEIIKLLNKDNRYFYIEKMITYADVPTFGKALYMSKDKDNPHAYDDDKMEMRAEKNRLFYTSKQDIINFEKSRKRRKQFFCETKQSNIYLPDSFYEFLNLTNPRKIQKIDGKRQYLINNNQYSVYLVNSCLKKYFEKDMTNNTLNLLGKPQEAEDFEISNGLFTNMDLHVAVHGVGTSEDSLFHAIRGNVFAKDKLIILAEQDFFNNHFNIYILFYRNPLFYQLNHEAIPYFLYDMNDDSTETPEERSRIGQDRWRNALAELALSMNPEDTDEIPCPFTDIKVKWPEEKTLFRASHIKEYNVCTPSEKYDVDNGFLIVANADALYDKHMITVEPFTHKIIKSSFISDELLDQIDIGRNRVIDSKWISSGKEEYLKSHFAKFKQEEQERLSN